jgi:hypothetical protein
MGHSVDVSEERIPFIFRVEKYAMLAACIYLDLPYDYEDGRLCEISVDFYRTTRRHDPEDHLHYSRLYHIYNSYR